MFLKGSDDFLSLFEVLVVEIWQGMEVVVDQGLVCYIGVFNFKLEWVKYLVENSWIKFEMNQVELYFFLLQDELLKGCQELGVYFMAYLLFGFKDCFLVIKKDDEFLLLEYLVVKKVVEKCDCMFGQVLISWVVYCGIVVILKLINVGCIVENLNAVKVELSVEDIQFIVQIGLEYCFVDGSFWVMEGSFYMLLDLWG